MRSFLDGHIPPESRQKGGDAQGQHQDAPAGHTRYFRTFPTEVDRMGQQTINQVLTIIYEPQFSKRSFGFSPRRGFLNALREVQKTVNEGCKYVVDLGLERFFDTVATANS